jgi:predicted secreted protein
VTAFEGVVVYAVTWWLVLFMVLPWGVRISEHPDKGHATSAPAQPRILLKMAITTGIAAVVWLVIYLIVSANLISFRPA